VSGFAPGGSAARELAGRYLARLTEARGRVPPTWHFLLTLTEEAAEAAAAWHRVSGWKRRGDSLAHVAEELADTVISAHVAALVLGIDLDAATRAKGEVLMTRDLSGPGRG